MTSPLAVKPAAFPERKPVRFSSSKGEFHLPLNSCAERLAWGCCAAQGARRSSAYPAELRETQTEFSECRREAWQQWLHCAESQFDISRGAGSEEPRRNRSKLPPAGSELRSSFRQTANHSWLDQGEGRGVGNTSGASTRAWFCEVYHSVWQEAISSCI